MYTYVCQNSQSFRISDREDFVSNFRRLRKIVKSVHKLCLASLSICPSVRPHVTIRPPTDIFLLHLSIFRKSVKKVQVSLKSEKNNGFCTRRQIYIFHYIPHIFSYNEMFRTQVEEKIKAGILCSIISFENRAFMR